MNEPKTDSPQFTTIAREVRRALLVTAFVEIVLPDGGHKFERVTDQMRRVLALVNELTFEAGQAGVWLRDQNRIARSLSIDKGDCSLAVGKLVKFGVLEIESRDDGWLWAELRTAKLAVAGRALEARAVVEEIEHAHYEREHQPELPGCERSLAQARNFGLEAAMGEVAAESDREAFAELRKGTARAGEAVGRFPTGGGSAVGNLPTGRLGNSQLVSGSESPPVGNLPTERLGISQPENAAVGNLPTDRYVPHASGRAGACARGDSVQIDRSANRSESGDESLGSSSGRQFRDSEKNWLFTELAAIDTRHELQNENCRRTWLARIRDCAPAVREAVAELKDEVRLGKTIRSPLGCVFAKAQSIARNAGKTLRSILFL